MKTDRKTLILFALILLTSCSEAAHQTGEAVSGLLTFIFFILKLGLIVLGIGFVITILANIFGNKN